MFLNKTTVILKTILSNKEKISTKLQKSHEMQWKKHKETMCKCNTHTQKEGKSVSSHQSMLLTYTCPKGESIEQGMVFESHNSTPMPLDPDNLKLEFWMDNLVVWKIIESYFKNYGNSSILMPFQSRQMFAYICAFEYCLGGGNKKWYIWSFHPLTQKCLTWQLRFQTF